MGEPAIKDAETKRRAEEFLRAFGVRFGTLTLHANDGQCTLIEPCPRLKPHEFPSLEVETAG